MTKWLTKWHGALIGVGVAGWLLGYTAAAYLKQPSALVLGVLAGLLTTIVVAAAAAWFNKVLVPWHEDRVYRGVRIDGAWQVQLATVHQEGELTLEQHAFDVVGSLRLDGVGERTPDAREYVVRGQVADRYVQLTAVARKKQQFGTVAMLLHVSHGGGVMEGSFSYQSLTDNQLRTTRCISLRPSGPSDLVASARLRMFAAVEKDIAWAANFVQPWLGEHDDVTIWDNGGDDEDDETDNGEDEQ